MIVYAKGGGGTFQCSGGIFMGLLPFSLLSFPRENDVRGAGMRPIIRMKHYTDILFNKSLRRRSYFRLDLRKVCDKWIPSVHILRPTDLPCELSRGGVISSFRYEKDENCSSGLLLSEYW
jgi:hypothetical protein